MLSGVQYSLRCALWVCVHVGACSESDFLSFDAVRQASQCLGRVIRSKQDYGIMVLADYRYDKSDKRKKLPNWIQQCLSASHRNLATDTAVQIARKFLKEMAQPQLAHRTLLGPAAQSATASSGHKTADPAGEGGAPYMPY